MFEGYNIFMKKIIVFALVIISCKGSNIKNDVSKDVFNGKIVFEINTKIENEKRFDKELSKHIKNKDSLFRTKNPSDSTWYSSNAPTIRLMLDPREDPRRSNSYYKPVENTYEYLDTLVKYNYSYGWSKFKVEINTITQQYTKYNIKTNRVINKKKYSFYKTKQPYKEIIYKDSVKTIFGFNCYKVLIVEDFLDDSIKELKNYKEMYVTEDINTPYHPTQIRKELLDKYYPLEVKIYSGFLRDKVTYYKAKRIESSN